MLNNGEWYLKNGNVFNTVSSKETSNQSNCVVSTLSNNDLTLTKWSFSAPMHQPRSLTHSLALSLSPSFNSTQLNSIKLNELINQSINQSDYSHIHSRINFHSLIHTLPHSLIHSHNFTHSLAHLIVHAFHHSPTDLLTHSFLRSLLRSLTQLFTHSRNNPSIHPPPSRSSIHTLSNYSYINLKTNF